MPLLYMHACDAKQLLTNGQPMPTMHLLCVHNFGKHDLTRLTNHQHCCYYRESHERRLRERNMYTEEQIAWMLDRSELYAEHNRQNPGFFDMFINSGEF